MLLMFTVAPRLNRLSPHKLTCPPNSIHPSTLTTKTHKCECTFRHLYSRHSPNPSDRSKPECSNGQRLIFPSCNYTQLWPLMDEVESIAAVLRHKRHRQVLTNAVMSCSTHTGHHIKKNLRVTIIASSSFPLGTYQDERLPVNTLSLHSVSPQTHK